jgi:hypothetical protein
VGDSAAGVEHDRPERLQLERQRDPVVQVETSGTVIPSRWKSSAVQPGVGYPRATPSARTAGLVDKAGRRAASWWTSPLCESLRTSILNVARGGRHSLPNRPGEQSPGRSRETGPYRKGAGDGPSGGSTITSNRDGRCAGRRTTGSSGRFVSRPPTPGHHPRRLPGGGCCRSQERKTAHAVATHGGAQRTSTGKRTVLPGQRYGQFSVGRWMWLTGSRLGRTGPSTSPRHRRSRQSGRRSTLSVDRGNHGPLTERGQFAARSDNAPDPSGARDRRPRPPRQLRHRHVLDRPGRLAGYIRISHADC